MPLLLITPPACEPVDLTAVKAHLRVLGTDDDTYITSLITVARKRAEVETARSFITQTLRQVLDGFPYACVIELQRPPLQAVLSVKYIDIAGVRQTLSTDYYRVDTISSPGRIVLQDGFQWPTTAARESTVEIEYTAGYGLLPSDIPEDITHAIKILCAHWYSAREPVIAGAQPALMPMTADYLLSPHRCWL